MSKADFFKILQSEVARIDEAKTSKRHEKIIEGFTSNQDGAPQAIIAGKNYRIFNSNDYLGLRLNQTVRAGEHEASEKYGSGPGAVRFISGSLKIYKDLEASLAKFHGREDAMVFSSAFAANLAIIFSFIKGQAKDSLVGGETIVISDALNHRSIIDGIRVAGLPSEQKAIYQHLDYADLDRVLTKNQGKYKRALVISDGIFSMLGETVNMQALQQVAEKHDQNYPEGVITIVDDSHGVAAFGATGRGCEEATGGKANVLIGTMGKGFGADGGYVVANQTIIDYLRESAATYIYSNSISPAVAGAAHASVNLIDSPEGKELLAKSKTNIQSFKSRMLAAGFKFAADSNHPIQPLLIADAAKTKSLTDALFEAGILVTNINYPVVAAGKDEIRVQISAAHTQTDLDYFIEAVTSSAKTLGII